MYLQTEAARCRSREANGYSVMRSIRLSELLHSVPLRQPHGGSKAFSQALDVTDRPVMAMLVSELSLIFDGSGCASTWRASGFGHGESSLAKGCRSGCFCYPSRSRDE